MASLDHATLTGFDIGAARLIGDRTRQQDAYGHRCHDDYLVAVVADGLGWAAGSGLIAEASVAAVTAFGTALDHQYDPAHLIELARVTVALHADYASTDQQNILLDFEDGGPYGRRPDTCMVVATIGHDGEVHIGWVGDCRGWIRLRDGRLLQLTSDHNYADLGAPHIVTRTLSSEAGPETNHWHYSPDTNLRPTHLVLTTDGVHGPLPPSMLTFSITTAPTAAHAARWLTESAVRAAGTGADNATCMVVRLPDHDQERPDRPNPTDTGCPATVAAAGPSERDESSCLTS